MDDITCDTCGKKMSWMQSGDLICWSCSHAGREPMTIEWDLNVKRRRNVHLSLTEKSCKIIDDIINVWELNLEQDVSLDDVIDVLVQNAGPELFKYLKLQRHPGTHTPPISLKRSRLGNIL